MTTLLPLPLGCSGFALGFPGSLGVWLGWLRWETFVSSGMGYHWWWTSCAAGVQWGLAGGFGPSAFIGVCCFCISLSTAGQWMLVCGGGMHWWMWGYLFSMCSGFWCMLGVLGALLVGVGLRGRGCFSVWLLWSLWHGPCGCSVDREHLSTLAYNYTFSFSISY